MENLKLLRGILLQMLQLSFRYCISWKSVANHSLCITNNAKTIAFHPCCAWALNTHEGFTVKPMMKEISCLNAIIQNNKANQSKLKQCFNVCHQLLLVHCLLYMTYWGTPLSSHTFLFGKLVQDATWNFFEAHALYQEIKIMYSWNNYFEKEFHESMKFWVHYQWIVWLRNYNGFSQICCFSDVDI